MDLVSDGRPDAGKIRTCQTQDPELVVALTGDDDAAAAAAAIVLGVRGDTSAVDALVARLGDADLRGRAVSWALGRLHASGPVLSAIAVGRIGTRENGYRALAVQVASGGPSAGLIKALRERVEDEIVRCESGGMGIGDQACRVLAMLGDEAVPGFCDRIMAADSFADKFELQRLRKAMAADGRDKESLEEFAADWESFFADDLTGLAGTGEAPVAPTAEPVVEPAPSAVPEPGHVTDTGPATATGPAGGTRPEAPPAPGEEPPPDAEELPEPILDWQGYVDAADLDPQQEQVILRIGPTLEQLSQMALGVGLDAIQPDQFAAVMLQVLPQALGPQVAQAVLAPEMLNAFQQAAVWFSEQGHGDNLLRGIKRLREIVREQIRASGMLGGPDYSDPDDGAPQEPLTG